MPGSEIAFAIPTSTAQATAAMFMVSFLPGLLANKRMAQRSHSALLNPYPEKV
jgi:hypothetical protein